MQRSDGPLVVQLPREAGKRESRYQHLFSGEVQLTEMPDHIDSNAEPGETDRERLNRLEQLVNELRLEVDELKAQFGQGNNASA